MSSSRHRTKRAYNDDYVDDIVAQSENKRIFDAAMKHLSKDINKWVDGVDLARVCDTSSVKLGYVLDMHRSIIDTFHKIGGSNQLLQYRLSDGYSGRMRVHEQRAKKQAAALARLLYGITA